MMRIRSIILVVAAVSLGFAIASPAGATRITGRGSRAVTLALPDVKAFGDAKFVGSTNSGTFNQPIVGIAGTKSAQGYWEAARDGGVFTFGAAKFFGSMGAAHLNGPVVGIAATPTGNGYWLAARDGGVFAFGDAKFRGSTGGTHLNQPVVGMTGTLDGAGYWLAASDGGVFAFGDARFFGSMGGASADQLPDQSIAGMAARPGGDGYWLADVDGRVFPFGHAPDLGDAASSNLSMPVVAIASTLSGGGFWLAGRGAEAAFPEQVTEPGCALDGSQRTVRPAFFLLACGDGNIQIEHARWSVWGTDHASGTGTLNQNDCQPFCAVGHFHSQTGDLTLYQPVVFRGHHVFSRLRVQLDGPLAPYTTTTIIFTLV